MHCNTKYLLNLKTTRCIMDPSANILAILFKVTSMLKALFFPYCPKDISIQVGKNLLIPGFSCTYFTLWQCTRPNIYGAPARFVKLSPVIFWLIAKQWYTLDGADGWHGMRLDVACKECLQITCGEKKKPELMGWDDAFMIEVDWDVGDQFVAITTFGRNGLKCFRLKWKNARVNS